MDLIKKYTEFVMTTTPSKSWKVIRFILHWITLPIKVIIIGGLGLYQIIKNSFAKNIREVPPDPTLFKKQLYFNTILQSLPLLKTTEQICYVNRVPYYSIPTGENHNSDHQCSRHSTYFFLMNKLGLSTEKLEKMQVAVDMMMQGKWLCRGYKYKEYTDYNVSTVSGDMLCGLNLAIFSKDQPNERFDQLIANIIENDYALLEGHQPDPGDPGDELYEKLLKANNYRSEKISLKSSRGMWHPGVETVGAQALTILSALRLAEVKNGNREAGREYKKLLFKYGYGLLSLFPTAFIKNKRGYFNDHNCMIALYVLSKLSKSKAGKLFWKIPMVYVWLLSKNWYNGYLTGLVKDCYPDVISDSYIRKCQAFLYENEPITYTYTDSVSTISDIVPVRYNDLDYDEFSPDSPQDRKQIAVFEKNKVKSGLGFIACAIMLEKDPKDLLK